jgi:hypothetical protein
MATAVLIAGAPTERDLLIGSGNPTIATLREGLPKGQLEDYVTGVDMLDAIRFIGQTVPTPILMQYGNFDQFLTLDAMKRLAEAAESNITVHFYDADHEVNTPRANEDRDEWLRRHLKLRTSSSSN